MPMEPCTRRALSRRPRRDRDPRASDATRGALLAAEVTIPAGGGPPALHRHEAEEIYRVERGELALYLDDGAGGVRRTLARRDACIHIPGGRAHTIRNESDTEASAYVVFSPASQMEAFLRAAGALGAFGLAAEAVLARAKRSRAVADAADRARGAAA